MAMNPLPPQAYTKETLLRAYSWLQNQNSSIREMASTPDILVSLFLKATRDGDSALDRPSIKNFKSELKNLAGLMGDLEKPQTSQAQNSQAQTSHAQFRYQEPQMPPPQPPPQPVYVAAPQVEQKMNLKTAVAETPVSNLNDSLDELSIEMLHEIKEGFNLSSQSEAMRLLIKLGYLKARKILSE